MKHEKSYLENEAREMGQRVRRINETCRKGVQQMFITVPPLSLESAERAGTTPDSPRMEPCLSPPLPPRNPDTFESPQDCSRWIPQGQNFVHSAPFPALLSQYTSSVRLKVRRLTERAVMPTRATPGSAAYDIYAAGPTAVPARGQALVDTDLAMELPRHVYGQIKSRSGLTTRNRVTVQAGTIDRDYSGHVIVVMVNTSDHNFPVRQEDRIAQMVLELHLTPEVQQVTELDSTTRGGAGFGSTGVSARLQVCKWTKIPPLIPHPPPLTPTVSRHTMHHTQIYSIFSLSF